MSWWNMRSVSWFRNFRCSSQDVASQRLDLSAVTSAWFSPLHFPLIEYKNQEERMREVQLGSHTVRSHGFTVARTHCYDWLILMLLGAMVLVLNVINPFYRFVGKDMMTDLKYPLKPNTVPIWAVAICAVLLPMAIFFVFYCRRRDVYDLHHATLGILFSVLVTAVITNAIKDAVGRPRPDFFWRCFPDGKDFYDQWGNVICHGEKSIIKEGHKSFPSGHTSSMAEYYFIRSNENSLSKHTTRSHNVSFAGLGFLSLYLSGKIKVFDNRGHIAKLCVVVLPLLVASLIGISRVDDYWHHWQDVFAGGLLGLVVATFCYLHFFPPPYHAEGWGPYAYFRVLEESRAITLAATNSHNGQTPEAEIENQQEARNNNGGILSGGSSLAVEDPESGRRPF